MSLDQAILNQIPGGRDLLLWFEGRAPTFHDAEIISVLLDRDNSRCLIAIHTFEMTNEVDNRGYFVNKKHVVVSFEIEQVSSLELSDFNHQNVIDGITLDIKPNGEYSLSLEPCYGLSGTITGRNLKIALTPGIPSGSIYAGQHPTK